MDSQVHARLISIQIGQPRELGTPGSEDPLDQPWRSAIIKTPVRGSVWARREGLEGDEQADRRHHGGFDKAVLAYCAGHYPDWRRELGMPEAEFGFGAFGENLTIVGLDEKAVCIGDVYRIGGEVRVEVSQPRQPCMNLTRRWRRADLMSRVKATGRTGWYLRVAAQGRVEAGMEIVLRDRPQPEWTVDRAQKVMAERAAKRMEAEALAGLPELSVSWKETLLS